MALLAPNKTLVAKGVIAIQPPTVAAPNALTPALAFALPPSVKLAKASLYCCDVRTAIHRLLALLQALADLDVVQNVKYNLSHSDP